MPRARPRRPLLRGLVASSLLALPACGADHSGDPDGASGPGGGAAQSSGSGAGTGPTGGVGYGDAPPVLSSERIGIPIPVGRGPDGGFAVRGWGQKSNGEVALFDRYGPDGALLGSVGYAAGSSDSFDVLALAVDASGSVAVAGHVRGTVTIGDVVLSGSGGDVDLAVFDPSGKLVWADAFGSDVGQEVVSAVAFDPSGNVVLAANANGGPGSFGGDPLPSAGSGFHVVIASFGPTGSHRWSRAFEGRADCAKALAVDASGVLLAGSCVFARFGETQLGDPAGSGADAILARFDLDGELVWAKSFGGPQGRDGIQSATLAPSGDIVATGYFTGTLALGASSLEGTGPDGIGAFVASFAPATGEPVWGKGIGGCHDASVGGCTFEVAARQDGRVLIAGTSASPVDFGGGPLDRGGELKAALVAELDPSGSHRHSRMFAPAEPATADAWAYAAVPGVGDAMVLLGSCSEALDFGAGPLPPPAMDHGYLDGFLVRFGP